MQKSIEYGPRCVRHIGWTCALLGLWTAACTRVDASVDPEALRPALVHYSVLAEAIYGDAVSGVETLARAVDELRVHPSEQTLSAAKDAYLRARIPYRASEVFRFYGGPIDEVEVWVNTWPIDENFVEAEPDSGSAGIIDDRTLYPALSAELIAALNARDGETAISTGYHVIEFLLWGRDHDPHGPGKRAATDFVSGPGGKRAELDSHVLAGRRAHYLALATALLAQQLRDVRDAWRADRPGAYRARFLALPPREAVDLVVRGMGMLSGPELAGERLTVGYETKDQENEQSCFSDTTSEDIAGNVDGIANICAGSYRTTAGQKLSGPGMCAAIALLSQDIAGTLSQQIAESARLAHGIPAPFDQALLGRDDAPGRLAIGATVRALRAQAHTLSQAAALLRKTTALASAR